LLRRMRKLLRRLSPEPLTSLVPPEVEAGVDAVLADVDDRDPDSGAEPGASDEAGDNDEEGDGAPARGPRAPVARVGGVQGGKRGPVEDR